ncbi:hypothetical protein MD537_06865 [Flavihumibacter sediminis]|nr:hypothetical protein [Flavihumibacter sediminis]
MKTVLFVKVGKAYYYQGFINIKVAGDSYFGNHDDLVSVQLNGKGDGLNIEARIDRTANPNKTPRLMMGRIYTQWVQDNCKMGDELIVKVLDKNSIAITKQPKI